LNAKQADINKRDEERLAGVSHKVRKPAREQNPLVPVQGIMPKDAESTMQAQSDMDSYFDSLQSAQSTINKGDEKRLAGGHAGHKDHTRLSAAASQQDLNSYFDQLSASVGPQDSHDVKQLRKDSSPANAGNGVRVAASVEEDAETERKAKIAQLKVVHAQKRVIARRQARGRQH